MNLEELKQKEAKLWLEVKELEKPYKAKEGEWAAVWTQVQRMQEREKLRDELRAELLGQKSEAA